MDQIQHQETRPRGIYLLPNLFTISSIFAGFYAIISTLKGNFESAAISIFIAMIMDSLDGRVARLTNTMTDFGAELDSLADMVSFAIAPAVLVYSFALFNLGKLGWLSAFVFAVAVALRLARFNTQLSKLGKRYFQGLPCPAGAAVIVGIIWSAIELNISSTAFSIILAIITVITGILMVSNIRYRSFKDTDFKNHVRFMVILLTVLIIVLISVDPAFVLCIIFTTYAISGPIATTYGLQKKKRAKKHLLKSLNIHYGQQ